MAIPDSDPRAQDLDAAFAAAMDGPARPRSEAKTPAEVDHDAPHGRDEAGQPLAPFGWTKPQRKDEVSRPKLTGGRPSKHSIDAPRTGTVTQVTAPAGAKDAKGKPQPHDWTEELDGLATAAWFGLSAVAKVGASVPVLGRFLPGEKLAAQAFILDETKPRLIGAINLAAQHNAKAAEFCARLEGGDGLWALTCMFMVMPVVSLSATIWKGDEKALKEAELPTLAEMASQNEDKLSETLKKIELQITAAAAAAEPAPAEVPADA